MIRLFLELMMMMQNGVRPRSCLLIPTWKANDKEKTFLAKMTRHRSTSSAIRKQLHHLVHRETHAGIYPGAPE